MDTHTDTPHAHRCTDTGCHVTLYPHYHTYGDGDAYYCDYPAPFNPRVDPNFHAYPYPYRDADVHTYTDRNTYSYADADNDAPTVRPGPRRD